MRSPILALLFSAVFLVSCAHQGVIVRKDSGPQPFYHSLGTDGSYAFLLRDASGAVRRQLVTPEVFERYAVGEYFNDLQPPPSPRDVFDGKTMLTPSRPARSTVILPERVTKVRATAKKSHHRLAARKHARKRLARRGHHRRVVKVKRAPRSPQLVQTNARPARW